MPLKAPSQTSAIKMLKGFCSIIASRSGTSQPQKEQGDICAGIKTKKLLYREPVQQPLRFTAYYLYLTISAGTSAAEMNRIHFAMPTSSQMSGICTAPKKKLLSR